VNEPRATGEIERALAATGSREARAERIAEAIRVSGRYRWVGLYDVGEEEISIVAWAGQGEPAYPRFPRTQGLCGAATAAGETVVVGDVTKDPRYLTTFGSTRSEIVVPVLAGGRAVGLVDVESERANAFGDDDRTALERCAGAASALWA
jgi:GAF domain-containing protein